MCKVEKFFSSSLSKGNLGKKPYHFYKIYRFIIGKMHNVWRFSVERNLPYFLPNVAWILPLLRERWHIVDRGCRTWMSQCRIYHPLSARKIAADLDNDMGTFDAAYDAFYCETTAHPVCPRD